MALQPKAEPGSPPGFASTSHKNYKEMSISELVSVLRTAYYMDDFDKVEEELVRRDAKLKAEIEPLLKKIELERQTRVEAEETLKNREEHYERGKKAQKSYEKLLKEVKRNGLVDKNAIEELRDRNLALEHENCKLKKKLVDDSNATAEFRIKIGVLDDEKADDKRALDGLRMKNTKLEEAVKKNLTIIEELRTENYKLEDEKRALVESLEKKFRKLNERVVKLEDDTKLLMSLDASDRNTKLEPHAPVIDDEENVRDYELGNDILGPAYLQRNEDTRHPPSPNRGNKDALGASAGGRLELENVIEIIDVDDDDDDGYTSQGLHGKKAISQIIAKDEHQSSSDAVQHKSIFTKAHMIEMVKRKYSFSDIETSTSNSSSSTDSLNVDNLPISSRAITCKKRSKT